MEKKFTKGDWTTGNLYKGAVGVNDKKVIVADCSFDSDVSKEEQAANAKLISAAPDLLKACESMLLLLKSENIVSGSMRKAEQAIKKALL